MKRSSSGNYRRKGLMSSLEVMCIPCMEVLADKTLDQISSLLQDIQYLGINLSEMSFISICVSIHFTILDEQTYIQSWIFWDVGQALRCKSMYKVKVIGEKSRLPSKKLSSPAWTFFQYNIVKWSNEHWWCWSFYRISFIVAHLV